MASAPKRYERHRPETTVLCAVVQQHLESFLLHVRESTERKVSRYVEREFRRYAECGILPCGFARAECRACRGAHLRTGDLALATGRRSAERS